MVIQILLDGRAVSIRSITDALTGEGPTATEAKKLALKAALADREITWGEALRVTFYVLNDDRDPVRQ